MKASRTENARRNMIWGMLNKCVILLLPFVLRTVMIRVLGSQYLGLNGIFTAILHVLNMTEMGFGSAVIFSMYRPVAEDDIDTMCALLKLYRKAYRIIGAAILVLGLALIPFLKMIINWDVPAGADIYVAYIIFLANTVLSYLMFAYRGALLTAHQRNDILSNIETTIVTVQNVLQLLVLVRFRDYYGYIVILPAITAAKNIVTWAVTRRMFPNLFCRGRLDLAIGRNIRKHIGALAIQQICGATRNSFDNFILSSMFGLTMVAMYGNYYYILSAVHVVLGVITSAITSGVGNSIASEGKEKNYADMQKFTFLYGWLSGWCMTCLLCLYQPFIQIWVGVEMLFPMPVAVAFCIYLYALCIGDIRSLYTMGAGLFWEGKYRSILESLTNIVLNVVLGKIFGVTGIVAATAISLILVNFGYGSGIVFRHYFQNGKLKNFYAAHLVYAAVSAIVAAVTYGLCYLISDRLVIRLAVCIVVPNLLYFAAYHRTGIFKKSISVVINLQKR